VLADLDGKPMLARLIERLNGSRRLSDIVVATTGNASDDPVVALTRELGVSSFRGPEDDVLARFVGAALQARAEQVVRITGDCPLIDPSLVDRVIDALTSADDPVDYASNTLDRTYPRGLDVEAFFADILFRVARLGRSAASREHVTYFIHRERPDLFLLRSVKDDVANSDLRWTVDTGDDLEVVRRIWKAARLGHQQVAYRDLLAIVRRQPELSANAHVRQKDA